MSKKLYSTSEWRRRTEIITKRAERRRTGKSSSPRPGFRRISLEVKNLDVPLNFSLRDNPAEMVAFLNRLERNIENYRLKINFEEVLEITPEAVMALVATMKKFKKRNVTGSMPKLQKAREILIESGFFAHVRHGLQLDAASQGRIAQFEGETVDGARARELIMHGTEAMTGERSDSQPAYAVILEAMQNTLDHAHIAPGYGLKPTFTLRTEMWWAMVYIDAQRERILLCNIGYRSRNFQKC